MRYTVEVTPDGTFWYKEGTEVLHKTDGPAIEWSGVAKYWYLDGKLHREDGPAIEWAGGTKSWYRNGERMTEQEFLNQTAPAKELTVAEIEQLLGYRVKVVK